MDTTQQLPTIIYGNGISGRRPIEMRYMDAVVATEISQFVRESEYSRAKIPLIKMTESVREKIIGRETITEKELYSTIRQVMEEDGFEELAKAFASNKGLVNKI